MNTLKFLLGLQHFWLLLTTVSVNCQEDEGKGVLDCSSIETRPLGCPELICKLKNSRTVDFCKDVECDGLLPKDCPPGSQYESALSMCGCCGRCARYLGLGEPCDPSEPEPSVDKSCTDPLCPIVMNRCQDGLTCKYLGENSKTCVVDPRGSSADKETCKFKRNLALTGQLHWKPECDLDGTYAPKQCKGTVHDGTCFCVDPAGNRIFGREDWRKAANQTCACSRRVFELRTGLEPHIATLHCSSDGNYEPLQCDTDSGLCYCVDPQTGSLVGGVVPQDQWKLLPCYSVNVTGDGDPTAQYLRNCESAWAIGEEIRREGLAHGVDIYAVKDFDCDYDGSFKPLFRLQSQSHCVPKNGNTAQSEGNYQMLGLNEHMSCQCFRDSILYQELNRPISKLCELGTGNYAEISESDIVDHLWQCVDKDGFFYGDIVPETYKCCLTKDGCKTDTEKNVCLINNYKKCTDDFTYS